MGLTWTFSENEKMELVESTIRKCGATARTFKSALAYHRFPEFGVMCDGDDHFIFAYRTSRTAN